MVGYERDARTSRGQYIYGSGRIGTWNRNVLVIDNSVLQDYTPSDGIYNFERGERQYELVNHLGNVLVTISDKKTGYDDVGSDNIIDNYRTHKLFYSDYYPFGMQMVGRNGGDYRFAFNGMEQDKEVSGNGNSYTTPFRQYDPRLGRWKSPDALSAIQPNLSPYVGMDNNPISLVDPLGLKAEGGNGGGGSDGGGDTGEYPWTGHYTRAGAGESGTSPAQTEGKASNLGNLVGAINNVQIQSTGNPGNGWRKFVNWISGKGYINKAYRYARKKGIDSDKVSVGDGFAVIDESEYYVKGVSLKEGGGSEYLFGITEKFTYFSANRAKTPKYAISPSFFRGWTLTPTAESIGDLVEMELQGVEEINLGVGLMEQIVTEPEIVEWSKELVREAILMSEGNPLEEVKFTRKKAIQFGPRNKFEAAFDELTWAIRHAVVTASVIKQNPTGTIIIYFQVNDILDLEGSEGRSLAYNVISETLGFFYHGILGGTKAKTNGGWFLEYSPAKGKVLNVRIVK